ncbi:hypothetical protein B9Z55_017774 [Caenorhabditis nigoni]|nr:hypothetical protein B9Z55_017774 [Caenorhabditis nigoni]
MIVYTRLLLLIFWYKTIKKSPELHLFYCRFVFDLVISVISLVKMIIYGLSLTSLYDFFLNNHWLTFMFVWTVSSFSSLRAILVLFIALDRTCATYLPITFFKYRKLIPTFAIVGVVLSYSIVDTSVVFIICKVDLNTPTTCINALCVFGPCYQQYWLVFSKLFYAMIVILTLMLCAKLFVWNKMKKHNVNGELRRANRLALIDAFITIVFDFAPPIIHSTYPNFFDYVGAINSVSQTLGFVVESWLTTLNLEKRYQVKQVTASGKVVFQQSTADMTSLAACFGLSIYAIAVNFIYRFFALQRQGRLKYFAGYRLFLWMAIPTFAGLFWLAAGWFWVNYDEDMAEFIGDSINKTYGLDWKYITFTGGIYYTVDGNGETQWRIRNTIGALIMFVVMQIPFTMICYFGYKSRQKINKITDNGQSDYSRRLQRQLYNALIGQTAIPIVFLFFPIGGIFAAPLFHIEVGNFCFLVTFFYTFYPVFDPLPTLLFVDEYRTGLLTFITKGTFQTQIHPSSIISADVQ